MLSTDSYSEMQTKLRGWQDAWSVGRIGATFSVRIHTIYILSLDGGNPHSSHRRRQVDIKQRGRMPRGR